MKKEESTRLILDWYKENPYSDDSDFYCNGLCDSTEFLDHKPEAAIKKPPQADYIPRNSMCNNNTTAKQPEMIPSSKEAQKTNIRLTFKLNGNKVQSVRRSDNIAAASQNIQFKKRSYFEDEIISIPKRKKMSNDQKPLVKHYTKLRCISSTRLQIS